MLKEMIFLLGDIFGLGASGSTSLLCFKQINQDLVRYECKTDGRVSFDSLFIQIIDSLLILKLFYSISLCVIIKELASTSCSSHAHFLLTLLSD